MTGMASCDKTTGKCDHCGRMAVVSDTGSSVTGTTECPNCGSDDVSPLLFIE
jgi:DNA-directed RNA polymerase subunit RPC12/RpoP